MKQLHYVKMRVFVMPGEDMEKIKKKLEDLSAVDLEKEKISIESIKSKGFEEKVIHVLELGLKRSCNTKSFLENLLYNLDEGQKSLLMRQMESRLDENNHFYIRLDKEKLLKGEYFITDSGNCFHITMSVACYPSTRENAKDVLNEIFK